MNKFFYLAAFILMFNPIVHAEEINLVADEKVEWHQNEQKMVAVGNAVASKKDMNIRADTLTAFYENANKTANSKGKSQIKTVHAQGGVVMKSPTATGYGNKMDYDIAADTMILRGNPAKIQTDKELITATDNITYYPSLQKAVATGKVMAEDAEKNQIYSDRMISFFEKDAQGSMEMKRVEIEDNVKIITKDAIVTADRGIYLPKSAQIELFDNVIINQDGNFIKGDHATTDINTGITKLLTKKGGGKRVSGVFKEKAKEKPAAPAPTQVTPAESE